MNSSTDSMANSPEPLAVRFDEDSMWVDLEDGRTIGVPLEGLGILLGVDRIPDMFRTATNVAGDMAAAALVEGISQRDRSAKT